MITKICKECLIEKDLSEFYKHPQWVLWTLPRCKECIKAWRKTERERKMARVKDSKRSKTIKRKKYAKEHHEKRIINNPEKKYAQYLVQKYFRFKKNLRPNKCCNCMKIWRIELHHEDYTKQNEVIPLCPLCHRQYHSWIIDIVKDIIVLPF